MSTIVVAGLSQGAQVYLAQSRPLKDREGNVNTIRAGEYEHKNKAGQLVGFRRNLPTADNGGPKPFKNVRLNKIHVQKWAKSATQEESTSYSLIISTDKGTSHLINVGGGMVAQSVVNSFLSLLDKSAEEIAEMRFDISFYYSKKSGYNGVAVRDQKGDMLNWRLSSDEQKSLITKHPIGDTGKFQVDSSRLHAELTELCDALNKILPRGSFDQGSALDDIEQDDYERASSQDADADEVFGDDTEKPKAPVADIPFE